MESTGLPIEVLRNLKEFSKNVNFMMDNYQLLKSHEGEYVAVGKGKILGFSKKRQDLQEKYGSTEGLFIELVTPSNIPWKL